MVTSDEQAQLLRLARETLAAHLGGGPKPQPVHLAHPDQHSGAFVTLHVGGDLRGCIGHPGSRQPLDEVVAACAIAAATEDHRFRSITAGDLPKVTIEISVLTPMTLVRDVSEIEVGRDGLLMEMGFRKGLLLPQVATEYRWDRDTFLAHACMKAGLPQDMWQGGATIYRFQAQVFSEAH